MRKHLLLTSLLLTLVVSGCAWKAYYDACKVDAACSERAHGVQATTETTVSTIVAAIPHPLAQLAAKPAGKVVGYGGFLLAMLLFGRALTKRKVVVTGGVNG